MAGFISALHKQRKDAKEKEPDTRGRFNEIVGIIRKQDYQDGITPQIVVNIIQDLGPTFVKIGQIASQQSENIPAEYCDALSKLRSSVAPMDAGTVRAQIQKHLGKPVDELFASFDDTPLGSASIGQVHRAELADGTVVAVKVRRPGVIDTVARDFALIEQFLDVFAKDGIGGMDVKAFVVELEKTSKIELDFTNEASYLEKFRENNTGRAHVEVPKCYRELTNDAILTEDFVTGHEAGDVTYLETLDEEERDRLAALVADNFACQVMVDGFYHADPHSGNVLIKEPIAGAAPVEADASETAPAQDEEGDSDVTSAARLQLPKRNIEWIDFGMMGVLTAQQRQILLDLVTAIVMQDAYSLKNTVLKAAQPQGDIDHGALLEMCEGMCSQYAGGDFGDFNLGDLLGTVIGGLQDESYKIDPFLTNLARGIVAVEGTVKTLSPRVNILDYFIDKADMPSFNLDFSKMSDKELADLNGPIAMELAKFLDSVSRSSAKTADTLDMLEKGQISVRANFGIEDKASAKIDQIVSYSIRAFMIVALFIGSCLLCTVSPNAMTGTTLSEVVFPTIGFIGYILSVILAFLLYRSVKKGK